MVGYAFLEIYQFLIGYLICYIIVVHNSPFLTMLSVSEATVETWSLSFYLFDFIYLSFLSWPSWEFVKFIFLQKKKKKTLSFVGFSYCFSVLLFPFLLNYFLPSTKFRSFFLGDVKFNYLRSFFFFKCRHFPL